MLSLAWDRPAERDSEAVVVDGGGEATSVLSGRVGGCIFSLERLGQWEWKPRLAVAAHRMQSFAASRRSPAQSR